MSAYRYVGTKKVFSNKTEDPDNWCFCSGGMCNPSGIGNSSTCRFGTPVFVSFPHFYLADPYYLEHVEGLNPQKDLHEFFIDLEPVIYFFELFLTRRYLTENQFLKKSGNGRTDSSSSSSSD